MQIYISSWQVAMHCFYSILAETKNLSWEDVE